MSQTHELFMMAAIWTLIAIVVACFIRNWPGRIAFVTIAVGLPFWELPFGYYNFQKLCREETGLKVIEKFIQQDSVCLEYFDIGLHNQLAQAGFARIEIVGASGNAQEFAAKGQVFITNRAQAKSTYCIFFQSNIPLPTRVLRSDTLIVRLVDNFAVARQSRYSWKGMWWQQSTSPIFGFGGECFGSRSILISALRHGSR